MLVVVKEGAVLTFVDSLVLGRESQKSWYLHPMWSPPVISCGICVSHVSKQYYAVIFREKRGEGIA